MREGSALGWRLKLENQFVGVRNTLLGNTGLSVMVGATRPSQLRDNLAAADWRLTEDELARLEEMTRLTPNYPNWFNANIFDQHAKKAVEG